MDKYKELSKQLRYCGDEGKCQSCEFYRETEPCSQNLFDEAADAIEELLNVKWHESCTDCPLYDKEKHRCPRFNAVIPTAIEDALAELPSAQQEIIRCKDCIVHGVCRFEQGLGLDGYCSQAERRQKNERPNQ